MEIYILVIVGLVSALIGYMISYWKVQSKIGNAKVIAKKMEDDAKKILIDAEKDVESLKKD
ncbi:MAG: hypothetical protein JW870_17585, partial [Candidatus Delongbacteria bacterium]|nr:hypothetical protein [Candidatus Delongbacteria bacterium]